MNWLTVLLSVLFVCFLHVHSRKPKVVVKNSPRTPPPSLDVTDLPGLEEILAEINLSNRLREIVKMGVTDTRLFLRMSKMDFSLMKMEWNDITEEEIDTIKKKQAELLVVALKPPPVKEDTTFVDKRKKLLYGRLYLADGPQSFDFVTGSFGAPMPIGPHPFHINYKSSASVELSADTGESVEDSAIDSILTALTPETAGCVPYDVSLTGKMVIARRGLCSFLEKAKLAHAANASALVVVNSEDTLESISSGLGVVKDVEEKDVLDLASLAILSVTNTSWAKFASSWMHHVSNRESLIADVIPLACSSGDRGNLGCQPVLPEERLRAHEVSWGILHLASGDSAPDAGGDKYSADFLASTFGGKLLGEGERLPLYLSSPMDACSPVTIEHTDPDSPIALVVNRGGCTFDVKMIHAQKQANVAMVIMVDVADNALQRIGANEPQGGYIGIPAILVTAPTGIWLQSKLAEGLQLSASLSNSMNNDGSKAWIDLALMQWADNAEQHVLQLEGLIQKCIQDDALAVEAGQTASQEDIREWLQRQILLYPFNE